MGRVLGGNVDDTRGVGWGGGWGCFFFNDTATTEIYTLSLHDALPILNDIIRTSTASLSALTCALLFSSAHADDFTPAEADRKSTRLNSSHPSRSRMPSSA